MFGLGNSPKNIERLGRRGKAVKLAKLLKHKHEDIRVNAARALGSAPAGDDAINALVAALNDKSKPVLLNVIASLGSVGTSPTLEHLKYLREHQSDPEILNAITAAIGQIHTRTRS